MKSVIILIGPPGSGKGTQADLISERFGLFHLESSKVIEDKLKDVDPDDLVLQREKKFWESGILNTPELVLQWIQDKIKEIAAQGRGIVFSGSPRTIFEAEGEMPLLEQLYGKDNIAVFNLELSEEDSIKRNSKRRICLSKRHPIPDFPEYENITRCPKDGSEIVTRVLDTPETTKIRYKEYINRTLPVIDILIQQGYRIIKINADQPIEKVYKDIMNYL
jgi:adenylate kinase